MSRDLWMVPYPFAFRIALHSEFFIFYEGPGDVVKNSIDMYPFHNLKWIAYDGERWVHSCRSINVPKSRPTNKQVRTLRFGLNNET